jgi:hypothetical protein
MMQVAVGIASTGRAALLSEMAATLVEQTRRPDAVFVCVASPADCDAAQLRERLGGIVTCFVGPRGLTLQRNAILDRAWDADVLLFLDDDFLMAPDYIAECEALFAADPAVVMATGHVVADGLRGPGIPLASARRLLAEAGKRRSVAPVYSAYGCNMAVRGSVMRASGQQFDTRLPFYGFLEDLDFSRGLARYGKVVRADQCRGVHLAVTDGRMSGCRLGYSQIANPIYLMRKRRMSSPRALTLMGRCLAANVLKAAQPEPWVDRLGRLRGNAIALADLVRGGLDPRRVAEL